MKKILTILVLSVAIFSCSSTKSYDVKASDVYNIIYVDKSTNTFYYLHTNDNFETATLNEYYLKNVSSASGVKLATSDNKVSIHFKDGYAVITSGDKEILVFEVRE